MCVHCSGSQAGGRGSIDLGLWAPNTIFFPRHTFEDHGIRRPCPHCSENAAGNPGFRECESGGEFERRPVSEVNTGFL